jgi:hypothetical protein
VLFVNNNGSDASVPAALALEGHNVTSTNLDPSSPAANTFFQNANLGGYCAVVWSPAYARSVANLSGATSSLSNWVSSGGHVAILSPDGVGNSGTNPNGQPDLLALLGASGGRDQGYNFSTVVNSANIVTTGLIDIRNTQPSIPGDTDTVCSPLLNGTVGLVTSPTSNCSSEPGYAWSLRTLGSGHVAYFVSGNFNGSYIGIQGDPDWSSTTIPGDGVYNAGLRNFVHGACTPKATIPVPTLNSYMMVLLSTLLPIAGLIFWRRRQSI